MTYFQGRKKKILTATIDVSVDNDLSEAINIQGHAITGLLVPALDSCNLTFMVSDEEAGTYLLLKDKDGNAITLTVTTGQMAISTDDLTPLASYSFIKVKTSVGQSTDRDFVFVIKV
jgi:hypothetical protein